MKPWLPEPGDRPVACEVLPHTGGGAASGSNLASSRAVSICAATFPRTDFQEVEFKCVT